MYVNIVSTSMYILNNICRTKLMSCQTTNPMPRLILLLR